MVYDPPETIISFPLGFPLIGPAQLMLYPAVPPFAVIVIEPLFPLKHVTFETTLFS